MRVDTEGVGRGMAGGGWRLLALSGGGFASSGRLMSASPPAGHAPAHALGVGWILMATLSITGFIASDAHPAQDRFLRGVPDGLAGTVLGT